MTIKFQDRDKIETEFVKYQIDTLNDEIMNSERFGEAWHKIGDILDDNDAKKYKFMNEFLLFLTVMLLVRKCSAL